MGILIFSDESRAEVERVLRHAMDPANYYRPGECSAPGHDPRFVAQFGSFGSYRCVFSITVAGGWTFRHLTVSTPLEGRLPNVMVACTIATWFGFTGAPMERDVATGPGADWLAGAHETDACVVLAQSVSEP